MNTYYKRVDATTAYYYNVMEGLITLVTEKDGEYKVTESDHNEGWLKDNADEISQSDFDAKISNIASFARIGTHPPKPPGG